MDRERESHVVPTIVAVVGVVAFAILLYLLLVGADWLINRLLGLGAGTNI
jgi:preprotein translocase subunit SecE